MNSVNYHEIVSHINSIKPSIVALDNIELAYIWLLREGIAHYKAAFIIKDKCLCEPCKLFADYFKLTVAIYEPLWRNPKKELEDYVESRSIQ